MKDDTCYCRLIFAPDNIYDSFNIFFLMILLKIHIFLIAALPTAELHYTLGFEINFQKCFCSCAVMKNPSIRTKHTFQ